MLESVFEVIKEDIFPVVKIPQVFFAALALSETFFVPLYPGRNLQSILEPRSQLETLEPAKGCQNRKNSAPYLLN